MSKLFLLVVTMSWSIIASAQGIDFFHGSYEEALKKPDPRIREFL